MTQVEIRQQGDTMTACIAGEIDHHWAAQLRAQIDERARAAAPARPGLDFSAGTFMDSSGVGLILGRHRLVRTWGGSVAVQHAPPGIRRMLAIAGIEAQETDEEGGDRT